MASARTSLGLVAASSALSATITWVALLVAARVLGPDQFAGFLVVWGLYFGVTGVLAGLQQEVTRSAFSGAGSSGSRLLYGVALVAAGGVGLVLSTSSLWGGQMFGHQRLEGALVLALAFAGYGVANLINGVLASRREWNTYALLILTEAVLRAAAVWVVLHLPVGPVGWAVGITVGLSAWLLVGSWSSSVQAALGARGDANVRDFVVRAGQALGASACSAAMVTGFPPLVRLFAHEHTGSTAGVVFATILVTRAPVLILLNAFQGPIIRHLTDTSRSAKNWILYGVRWGVAATALASGGAYAAGPGVLRLLFGGAYEPDAHFVALATLGAGLLSGMTLAGWLVLALRRHGLFLMGWLLALGATIACLSLDLDVETRAALALVTGPGVGLALFVAITMIGESAHPQAQ